MAHRCGTCGCRERATGGGAGVGEDCLSVPAACAPLARPDYAGVRSQAGSRTARDEARTPGPHEADDLRVDCVPRPSHS